MEKTSQQSVNKVRVGITKKLSTRLSGYRIIFIKMAYRTGLTIEEVADIFGTTKQNVSMILKKNEN